MNKKEKRLRKLHNKNIGLIYRLSIRGFTSTKEIARLLHLNDAALQNGLKKLEN